MASLSLLSGDVIVGSHGGRHVGVVHVHMGRVVGRRGGQVVAVHRHGRNVHA